MTQGRKPAGDATPEALYQHCETAYRAMMQSATGRVLVDDEGVEQTIIVWEGMLTQFITGELHLSVPYYTKITQALKRMGCISQLKRGGGTAPSQWRLITEPTIQLFLTTQPMKTKPQGNQASLQQQMDSFNKRLGVMERAFTKIIEEEQAQQNG